MAGCLRTLLLKRSKITWRGPSRFGIPYGISRRPARGTSSSGYSKKSSIFRSPGTSDASGSSFWISYRGVSSRGRGSRGRGFSRGKLFTGKRTTSDPFHWHPIPFLLLEQVPVDFRLRASLQHYNLIQVESWTSEFISRVLYLQFHI